MSKSKPKRKQPNVPPAALLRARLEAAWLAPSAAQSPPEQLAAALEAAGRGLKPDLVAGNALAVYTAAAAPVQAQLDQAMPRWLTQPDRLPALETLVRQGQLPAAQQALALRWLAAGGRDTQALTPSAVSTFHSAYLLEGEWQAAALVLWYSNHQRTRARGFHFLMDGNPPWNGAVKDVMLLPNKTPRQLIRSYVDMWSEHDQPMTPVDAATFKRRMITALQQNAAMNIRLPVELVQLREQFVAHVLWLPDGPDTPAFTPEDFDALSQTGKPAEDLTFFEQTFGRRIRLDDGREVLVDPSLADFERDPWFDADDDADDLLDWDDAEELDAEDGDFLELEDDAGEDEAPG